MGVDVEPSVRATDEIDIHIGARVRELRKQRGMSLDTLAAKLGTVAWQQFQKYETGYNRISGSMLFRIAAVLDVHPGHFFAGLIDPKTGKPLPEMSVHSNEVMRELAIMPPDLAKTFTQFAVKVNQYGKKG